MTDFFLQLVNMSISASWLILAVVLFRLVFKKAQRDHIAVLWFFVAVRLVCPFSLKSMLSLIPSANTFSVDAYNPRPVINSGFSAVDAEINDYLSDHYFEGVTVPANTTANITRILCAVWLIGMAAMLLYACISLIQVRRQLREAVPLRDNILECDHISGAFILGIFRPKIYLPSCRSEADTPYILAHEKKHLQRWDHISKPLGYLLLCLHWFNPSVWLAYLLYCRDLEYACDEAVLRTMGSENKKAYLNALINCSAQKKIFTVSPLAFGEVAVKDRIKTVLSYKKTPFWLILLASIVSTAILISLATNPVESNAASLRITQQWDFVCAQDTTNGKVICCAENEKAHYPDAAVHNAQVFISDENLLRIQSGILPTGNNDFVLETEKESKNECIYRVFFNDETRGRAVISFTDYYGSYQVPCMILTIDGVSFMFMNQTTLNAAASPSDAGQSPQTQDRADQAAITGIVLEVEAKRFLITPEDTAQYGDRIWVTLPDDADRISELYPGATVRITYNGLIAETYPLQINTTYSVERIQTENDSIIYTCNDSPEPLPPSLCLYPNQKEFSFTYSLFSSYLPRGTYENTGKKLILRTKDGEYVYVFRIVNRQTVAFDQKNSSPIPSYVYSQGAKSECPIKDGAKFTCPGLSPTAKKEP